MKPSIPNPAFTHRRTTFSALLLALLLPATSVQAGVVAEGRMEWKAGNMVGFDAGGDRYPYSFSGPGTLVVTYTVSPYVGRKNYSDWEGLLQYDGTGSGWRHRGSEVWYSGRPAASFKQTVPADGSVASYKSITTWEIPAGKFSGQFRLIEPKSCNLNDCNRWAAAAMFTAEFFRPGESAATPEAPPIRDTDPEELRLPALERGIDRPGSDLGCHFPATTAADCSAMCAEDGSCRSFTWVRPGHFPQAPFNGNAICCLKHAVPAARRDACCVSGVKE
jgi:hypothetical protein